MKAECHTRFYYVIQLEPLRNIPTKFEVLQLMGTKAWSGQNLKSIIIRCFNFTGLRSKVALESDHDKALVDQVRNIYMPCLNFVWFMDNVADAASLPTQLSMVVG